MNDQTLKNFKIDGRVVIITGGAGLLGQKHTEAIVEGGGIPVLLDISKAAIDHALHTLALKYGKTLKAEGFTVDITNREELKTVRSTLLNSYGHIDVLINNAANNPKVEGNAANMSTIQFENFPLEMWNADITVGLTGALLCAQIFVQPMIRQSKGVILNISSDLGIIAPDQRIYRQEGRADEEQIVKPVTYSVVKHGLIGLTKYLATFYAEKGIRANTLCPAGVYNDQPDDFVKKLTSLVPMGRMASVDEYKSTILYLVSDASSYMTGSTVIVDGGRTVW